MWKIKLSLDRENGVGYWFAVPHVELNESSAVPGKPVLTQRRALRRKGVDGMNQRVWRNGPFSNKMATGARPRLGSSCCCNGCPRYRGDTKWSGLRCLKQANLFRRSVLRTFPLNIKCLMAQCTHENWVMFRLHRCMSPLGWLGW